ncbi:MAG: DNA-directed DNA polymerase [Candidatus Aenigmarchaeota archaeon]|nr:DNA-directed DNA polymerase [Candidatus Aenigmarchaeota archaeon]MDW8149622.1 DNA-directed DNA polymerase [Candidatus Aenigmarchaeota archaeon]
MKEKIFLLDIDYDLEGEEGVVLLFGKNEKNERILVRKKFFHYFFVLPKVGKEEIVKRRIESLTNLQTKILKVEIVKKRWLKNERDLIKITIQNPKKLKNIRDVIKELDEIEDTFEYNISFYKRFLMDTGIKPCSWIEINGERRESKGFDVDFVIDANEIKQVEEIKECEMNVLAIDTEWVEINNEEKLIMISLFSKNIKKVLALTEWENKQEFVESFKNEEAMIKRFLEIVKKERPDIIVSYNGDAFDFLKLRERAKKLKTKLCFGIDPKELEFVKRGGTSAARCFGVVHLDLFVFINKILSPTLKTEVLTLDEVANELIGERKIELEYEEMIELWKSKKGLSRIAEYSIRDAYLIYSISQVILPQIFSISRLTGEIPFDVCRYSYSQLVEAYLMKKAVEDKILIPNSPKHEEKEIRMRELPYRGAIVVEPKTGIWENIGVVDFRSLYPSIIATKNISTETFNCEHEECKKINFVPETNYHFCVKVEGFIPKHLRYLIEKRKEIKERMKKLQKDSIEYKILDNEQYAIKIISNAMYGYFAFIGARWYKKECAEATAAFGRYYIKKVLELAEKENFETIYGDTDSIFLTTK